MQNTITYHKKLLQILNDWLFNLNTNIFKSFDNTTLIKQYMLEYPMYSDIFYLAKTKKNILTLYNTSLLELILPTLSIKEINTIKQNCKKNIEILTYDIIALLNVFKHFTENPEGKQYVLTTGLNFDNKLYTYTEFFKIHHFFLKNYYSVLNILKNKGKA